MFLMSNVSYLVIFQRISLLFVLLLACLSVFPGCEKDPEVITKTVVEKDTITITATDTVFVNLTDTVSLTEFIHDTAMTFILVRHAETTGSGSNPNLSADGLERAEELVRVLKNIGIDGVYSTDFNRTQQTALPVATDKSLSVNTYNPSALNGFADTVLENHHGQIVLVVGHSNTTPDLLNILTGTNDFSDLPETQYDNFFVATVFEKGRAQVVHLKYGKPTP